MLLHEFYIKLGTNSADASVTINFTYTVSSCCTFLGRAEVGGAVVGRAEVGGAVVGRAEVGRAVHQVASFVALSH